MQLRVGREEGVLANNTIRGPILETKLLVEEEKEGFLVTHDGSGTCLVFQPSSFPCFFLHFLPFFASLDMEPRLDFLEKLYTM